ncbi:MAG: ribosome silencing factor [Alphaproteobacteria bacterium]
MIKSKEMLDLISNTLDINKAQDIKIIDLNGKAYFADYMVIATATSSRQCSALARYVEDELRKKGYKEAIISGKTSGDWVAMDCGDVVVHLFRPEVREFYDLEKLWIDPPLINK